jgi:hypothetical protein
VRRRGIPPVDRGSRAVDIGGRIERSQLYSFPDPRYPHSSR